METKSDTKVAVKYMLLGAGVMLVVVAAVLGVQHMAARGTSRDPAPTAQAPADTVPPPPMAAAPLENVEPAPVVAPAPSVPVKPQPPELTPEEKAALDAAAEAEKAAQEAARREEELAKERAHMQETFDARKKQVMGIIDAYFALPIEERPDYLQKAMQDLMAAVQADREAAGLPARPPRGGMMGREFLGMLGENATAEEKQKLQTFFNDVVQMQVARVQAEMAEQLKTTPVPDGPPPQP